MRAEHQARQPRPIAFVTSPDVADRIKTCQHSGLAHPAQNEIGRRMMLPREKNARKVL
jgi:hypothetical protein